MSVAESAPAQTVALRSSDGVLFNVEKSVAIQFEIIRELVENDWVDSPLPLPNISSEILAKVIEYCKRHAHDSAAASANTSVEKEELKNFDIEFVSVDKNILFGVMLAAQYLGVYKLVDLTCQKAADAIGSMQSPERVREYFNIENDFTPEEWERVCRETAWAFEYV